MHQPDLVAPDQLADGDAVEQDVQRVLRHQRQHHMAAAGALQLRHQAAAGAGHQRATAGRDDGLRHFDGAALHPAGFQRGQHLQYGGRFVRGRHMQRGLRG